MASIITSKYRTDNATLFYNDIAENEYFLFVSSLEGDISSNSTKSKMDFIEKTIFGKKFETDESVFYAIRNIFWENGLVYDQYDDAVDLEGKNFYAVVYPGDNDTGNYLIFKCLYNSNGSPSTTPPNFIADNTSQVYRTSDGYVWKFMFDLSVIEFDKFNTLGYLPIIEENSANTVIDQSPIDIIEVVNFNSNSGYENTQGTIIAIDGNGLMNIRSTFLNGIKDYYTDMYFYVINSNNVGALYEIKNYNNITSTEGTLEVRNFMPSSVLVAGSTFSIIPRVEVTGDGTGCVAIPVLENGRITRILVLEPGEGYTSAAARVIDPFGFNPELEGSFEERAILRPIISPKGGHATNIKDELLSNRVILYTGITPEDNMVIPTTNKYIKLGVVKNPEFIDANTTVFDNRLELELASAANLFVGEVVTQVQGNEIIFEGVIHEVANNTIFLTDYLGPYQNYANTDISLDPNLNITSSQGILLGINNINQSNYKQKTGEVYYMIDFNPVERTSESNEEYKILLEF
jgi:hypothetical protein